MNWTETETVVTVCTGIITICTGIVTCIQFFLWKRISKTKAYIEEKAKLLAQEEKIEVLTTIAERAKNMVIKEDIGEITKEIESVKDTFNKDLANLNADLTLLTNLQTNFLTKKDTIIKFNTLLERWIYSFLYTDKVDLYDNQSIDLDQQRMNAYYEDLQICFSTMKIYLDNEKLNKVANDILTYYLEFAHHKAGFLLEAKRFNIEQNAINSDTNITPSLKKSNKQRLSANRKKVLKEFIEKRKQNIDEITQRKISFEKECRSYIYKLYSSSKPV